MRRARRGVAVGEGTAELTHTAYAQAPTFKFFHASPDAPQVTHTTQGVGHMSGLNPIDDLSDADLIDDSQLGDDAAELRRLKKAERARAIAPDRNSNFDHLSLDDLRKVRHELTEQETRVSYWRRILQARVDLLEAGEDAANMASLGRLLTDAPSMHRRMAYVSVEAVDDAVLPLPDLANLWARSADPADPHAVAALVADLRAAEHQISEVRADLFIGIDAITAELIARFHENPSLALMALPHR